MCCLIQPPNQHFVSTPIGDIIGDEEKEKKRKERTNLSVLHYFPQLSIYLYFGESSLTLFLAPKSCICTSSLPKDDVTGHEDPTETLELAVLQGRAAPGRLGSLHGQYFCMLLPGPSLPLSNPPHSPTGFPRIWKPFGITVPVSPESRTP